MDIDSMAIWIPTVPLVMMRLVGIVMVAPVLSHSAVPIKIRLAAGVVMSLAVVARMSGPVATPAGAGGLAIAAGGELLIGAAIGYAAKLLFAGVQLGAFHVAQQMGLALGEVFNPSADQAGGPVRSTFALLAVVIFLLISGHRQLIGALLRTFETIPVGAGAPGQSLLAMAVVLLSSSFLLAIQVAGPVLVAMLLAAVAMGLLQKTLPQCNLLTTHLPVRAMMGLVVLAASLAVVHPLLVASVKFLVTQISALA